MNRLDLHEKFLSVLGSNNVYFQPPESIKIKYPAIIYSLDNIKTGYADNEKRYMFDRYRVTLVDPNPDNEFIDKIMRLPYSEFNNHFVTSGLHHYNFTIYNA